ncbi:MFS family permease [Amycolatopsis lexingtonensis]|uniref:MFS family permease n=2 Tax=Amycolatopsis lexingtonensis TaxID=218822 RepID=A0ABR9ICQ3_9PSEU|nr:MFS family permease [Amycolatopsis lexingtonensis]
MPITSYRLRWAALAVLLTAEAMNLLDATIVQVAGPAIPGLAAAIPWFSAAYTLPFAAFLITGGRLGDVLGRAKVFKIGMAGFVLASLACAAAPDAGVLIGARAAQGAAAALVIPQTIGLIRALFDGAELAKALGTVGPVMGLSAVTGPLLGGLLTQAVSWRAAFLVNVPLGLAVLFAARLLREDHVAARLGGDPAGAALAGAGPREDRATTRPHLDPAGTALLAGAGPREDPAAARPRVDSIGSADAGPREDQSSTRPRIDPIGTVLVAAGAGLLVYPLLDPAGPDWRLLAAGVALLVAFGFHQRRSAAPLVEPSLFTHRGFPAALAGSLLFFAAMTGLMQVVPMQLQLGLGADVRTAGLTLLPLSAGLAVSSWFAGTRLVPRFGARVMFGGLALLLLGILAAIAVYASVPGYPWPLPIALALCGLGMGTFTVPFFTAALARVRPHETGSAAGLLNAVQQLGGTLGVALLGGLYLGSGTATAPLGLGAGLVVAAAAAVVPLSSRRGR